MRLGSRQLPLQLLDVRRLGGGQVRRDKLQVVDLVAVGNHFREIQQHQHLPRQGRLLLARGTKMVVEAPGRNRNAAALIVRLSHRRVTPASLCPLKR